MKELLADKTIVISSSILLLIYLVIEIYFSIAHNFVFYVLNQIVKCRADQFLFGALLTFLVFILIAAIVNAILYGIE